MASKVEIRYVGPTATLHIRGRGWRLRAWLLNKLLGTNLSKGDTVRVRW